jgi:hypothetical protein
VREEYSTESWYDEWVDAFCIKIRAEVFDSDGQRTSKKGVILAFSREKLQQVLFDLFEGEEYPRRNLNQKDEGRGMTWVKPLV